MHDDPSQHDIPRPTEMREVSFGPIVNPDGSPSDFTKAMFGVKNDENERTRHENRISELLRAIHNDVEDLLLNKRDYSSDKRQITLLGIRECANDAYNLGRRINQIQWDMMTETRNRMICTICQLTYETHDTIKNLDHEFTNALNEPPYKG